MMDRVIARDVQLRHRRRPASGSHRRHPGRDVTFKHVLLPVWLAAYKYRGKTYRFVVNGRTGTRAGRTALVGLEDRARGDRSA